MMPENPYKSPEAEGLRFSLIEILSETEQESVYTLLREYNAAANPDYWQKCNDPIQAARSLGVFARDVAGNIIGGLLGETQFAWLKIELMAVSASARRQGIGRQLVKLAEAEAVRRGCRYAFVDTMQYQSSDFYERLSYSIAGILHDWDSHGHAKYLLTKNLLNE